MSLVIDFTTFERCNGSITAVGVNIGNTINLATVTVPASGVYHIGMYMNISADSGDAYSATDVVGSSAGRICSARTPITRTGEQKGDCVTLSATAQLQAGETVTFDFHNKSSSASAIFFQDGIWRMQRVL